jgi:methylthioribose-1-phosphate isomerase
MPASLRVDAAYAKAAELLEEDVATNRSIGDHGLAIFRKLLAKRPKGEPLRVLTHCNAGRIATLDWGTATAPIYRAQQEGLPIHVWVSETRPRNQGAALTAWELGGRGVAHTLIADNAAGHLMQHGLVDVVIVGADRVTAAGDVANKIGTYMVAVLAHRHRIPFYVACPLSTIDISVLSGEHIPIEERPAQEVTGYRDYQWAAEGVKVRNPSFDVTPAELVTALITEIKVINAPNKKNIKELFSD